MQTNYPQVQDI